MEPIRMLIAAAILAVLSLTACGRSIQEETEARFKLNPHPKQAYRLKIKINDAPGPLQPMHDTYVRYAARNCSYVINPIEGATTQPMKYIDTEIRQTGKDEYETVFYFDAVLDEDYFGEGVCHWQPDGFGGIFKASGKEEETGFTISDVMENLLEKKTLTKYYWKGDYPYSRKEDGSIFIRSDGVGFTDWGGGLDMYPPERHKDLFSITVTLEEV